MCYDAGEVRLVDSLALFTPEHDISDVPGARQAADVGGQDAVGRSLHNQFLKKRSRTAVIAACSSIPDRCPDSDRMTRSPGGIGVENVAGDTCDFGRARDLDGGYAAVVHHAGKHQDQRAH